MLQPHHDLAHAYFAAVSEGDLPDALLTADFSAWTTTQGELDKAQYRQAIRLLARMCREPIRFEIDAVTAEDDRVVAEARSSAVLIDGQPYANAYVFAMRVRDGRIARIAEHFNPLIVQERLYPVMALLDRG